MRVLQVHNRYRFGGGEDVVVDTEAKLLREAGHHVFQYLGSNPESVLASAASMALAPWNPISSHRLRQEVVDGTFDVAHVHNTWFALSPAIFRTLKMEGLPVAATIHNYRLACINSQLTRDGRLCLLCVGRPPIPGIRYRCYRDSVAASTLAAATISINRLVSTWDRFVDLFLAPTPFVAEVIAKSGVRTERIQVKPHAVLDPGPRESAPSKSNRVLFVGRLSEEKGLDLLLTSWSINEELRLEIVGEGPLYSELRRRFPQVRFLGRQTPRNVQALMLASRALVFPSLIPETFGLVIAEAMASGLPVLASESLPIARTFPENPGVVLLDSVPNAWTSALKSLADDIAVDQLGAAARSAYLRTFSPTVTLPLLEQALLSIARP